jgi:RimJ/RimL family protein N-acetyltransferase
MESPIETTLDDGTPLIFRPIEPGDRDLLRAGFDLLSSISRYRRFAGVIHELSDEEVTFLTDVDQRDHVAWVAVIEDGVRQQGVGVIRYIRAEDDPETAEVAVTVIDAFQRRGIGLCLLWLAMRSAVMQGIRRFVAYIQEDNRPMRALLQQVELSSEGRDSYRGFILPLPKTLEEFAAVPVPRLLQARVR